jgi:protoporphyrinogen/coproporphyrinogen III oxidase
VSIPRVAIVGGGVSGLATAYFLRKLGIEATIFERSDRLGGLIKTDFFRGCRLEAGPDSYLAAKPAVTELAQELPPLDSQIVSSNDAARRIFIIRSGELIPLPAGMSMMVPGELPPVLESKLFSAETKQRFLDEQNRQPFTRTGDISVGELVADHFGDEALEYIADPLLVGVYGGDTSALSAESVLPRFIGYEQRYGSLIKGVREETVASPKTGLFRSFRDGMQSLTNALTPFANVIRGEVTAAKRNGARWALVVNGEHVSFDRVILACPAPVCTGLLESSVPELAAELAAIPYSSAVVATLLYEASQVKHPLDGFGFLAPRPERTPVAAATWINTKFPSRVAEGLVAIRVFIVAGDAIPLLDAADTEIAALGARELRRIMGIDATPVHALVYRWPQSMPQYVVGHKERKFRIDSLLSQTPGLQLVGNAYDGVGIPDCVRLARQAAQEAANIKSV